jgi:hypothetical protein
MKFDLDITLIVTPWIMTLFAKGTPIKLVYLIFDFYIQKNKQEYMFYMVTALIIM